MGNTVEDFGLDPTIYDNSRLVSEYRRQDVVTVIDLLNYKKGRKTPFKAYVDKINSNTITVGCFDEDKKYELYDYQIAERI